MRMHHRWQVAAVGLLTLIVSGPAYAVDGVIEINQARAKAGGVTPGDTPLFPVTIDTPGSYRLTGNLDVTDASARMTGVAAENTTAILVSADNVTIDLNGFMIKGPCSGSPTPCSPSGGGSGISRSGTRSAVSAMNGTVQGMGFNGVDIGLGQESQAEGIRAVKNGGFGIIATTVTHCTANSNNGDGIFAFTVTACTANSNGQTGISASTVTGCTATGNLAAGISALTVTGSSAAANLTGIFGTTVTGCTAINNTQNLAPQVSGIAGHNICGPPNAPCP